MSSDGSGDFSDFDEEESEDDSSLYFQEGENYLEEKNYSKAHECFEKVIKSNGFNLVDAIFFNGASLYKMRNFKECIKNYATFLSKHKSHEKINEVMFYVGSSYKEIGDTEQAKLFLKQVMKRAEGKPLAQIALKELRGI